MALYVDAHTCIQGNGWRRWTLQMLNYMLCVVNGDGRHRNATCHSTLHPSPYGDAVCVNIAVEINMLDYNVAICSVNGV